MAMNSFNGELTDALIKRHTMLVSERQQREGLWRECERWVDPDMAGGFYATSPGQQRDMHILDSTAPLGLNAFEAAMDGMLCPRGEDWSPLQTTDSALNDMPRVQIWLKHASDRLHACRNAPYTGYDSQSPLRWRHLGVYGTGALWIDEWVGRGLFYKTIHLSEIFIDEDFRGRTDTVHRQFSLSARAAAQMFGADRLPANITQALAAGKIDQKFTFVHVLRPNNSWEPGRLDANGFAIQSIYLALEGKCIVALGGYHTMPLIVSRYDMSPGDPYGRSPSMKVLGTIKSLNRMAADLLRASHLAIEPPLLYPEDGSFNRMSAIPGRGIPGGMENGRRQVEPLITGSNLPWGEKVTQVLQEVVNQAFLVHVFAIMNAPIDRQTATEYLGRKREAMLLQAPTAGRQESEALAPQVERELDVLMRANQIDPPPPEMLEARAGIRTVFDNPLSRAAKSANAQNFAMWIQAMQPVAQVDPTVFDIIDTDAAPRGLGIDLGVSPTYMLDPKIVAQKRDARSQAEQAKQMATAAPDATQAALNLAKAQQISGAPM
jgi:hypothetical protein